MRNLFLSRELGANETISQVDRYLNQASGLFGNATTYAQEYADYARDALVQKDGTVLTNWYLGGTNKSGSADEVALVNALENDKGAESNTDITTALLKVLDESAQYAVGTDVYFSHLDADGVPVHAMKSTSEMGDILWTPYKVFATIHETDSNGYLQFCGLASGPYTLTEINSPSGYAAIDPSDFYLASYDLMNPNKAATTPTTNPYDSESTDKDVQAKYAAWNTTFAAAKAANGGEADPSKWEFKLLNNQFSDDAIDGSGVALDKAVQIKNYEKSIFPLVGGIGTLFAVIAGLLAMGLALLKRKKDMKNEA